MSPHAGRRLHWTLSVLMIAAGLSERGLAAGAIDGPGEEQLEMQTLWEIGDADRGPSALALWPEDLLGFNAAFPLDPLFVIGRSDAKRSWPFFHPGPIDDFAGAREHLYTILFQLETLPSKGDSRLTVRLYDAHRSLPPRLRINVNGHGHLHETTPGSADWLEGRTEAGCAQLFHVTVPAAALVKGLNRVTIASVSGCWFVYDRISFEAPPGARMGSVSARTELLTGRSRQVRWKDGKDQARQGARVFVEHLGDETDAEIVVGDNVITKAHLIPGKQRIDVEAPAVTKPTSVPVMVKIDGSVLAKGKLGLTPVRDWTIFLLHHTHLDIGYTHTQDEVEKLQWKHLEEAIQLGQRTKAYPAAARFKWSPEGIWAVESYLAQADDAARSRLIGAVRTGAIGLDALFSNTLTGLCRPEELFELISPARRIATAHELTIDSAMISDIPGYTWGIVTALAQSGVKYLSIGPNRSHRIGYTLSEWGDRPFYWESPSGQERVLCWMAGKGYSWFHGPWKAADTFDYAEVASSIDPVRFVDYLGDLDEQQYPYDLVQLRYNIGSDNGPPDRCLPEFVRAWNERHESPKLAITTTSEMMRSLEERYGDRLPVMRGDFTPYWEDGAGSSAFETSINRASAERLVQAQTLWSMLGAKASPHRDFEDAWRYVLLFDEHTWGSWNSISDPDGDFTRAQWSTKRTFAVEGDRRSRDLAYRALGSLRSSSKTVSAVQVCNTASWARTDVVRLPNEWSLAGDVVKDASKRTVVSQRMSTGELVFLAGEVPPLGTAKFTLHRGSPSSGGGITVSTLGMSNGEIALTVDDRTGAINSLTSKGISADLVDRSEGLGLNDYLYVAGRDPETPKRNGSVSVRTKESGPLVGSLVIDSEAPGCRSLSREVRLYAGLSRVEMLDTLDKKNVYEKEGVHLAFPFNVPGAEVHLDVPWGVVQPEVDQLPGACKNYFTVGRWVDVSNDQYGVTLAPIDAPLIELGEIRADPVIVGWLRKIESSATVFSYVMNNYWETNYKAGQGGPVTLRYALRPHVAGGGAAAFDVTAAKRFGIERSQPLLVVPVDAARPAVDSLLGVSSRDVLVTSVKPSRDGTALMVRLFNASDRPCESEITVSSSPTALVFRSGVGEERGERINGSMTFPGWGVVSVRCELR